MKVCTCGKPATVRLRWNWMTRYVEAKPSKKPAWCLTCGRAEAARQTPLYRQKHEHELSFVGAERHAFETTVPVPHQWFVNTKQVARRQLDSINPGGMVEVMQRRNHIQVEICPPENRPEGWSPENVLYLLRYLTRLPMQFRPLALDESQSRATSLESLEQSNATLPPVLPSK